MSANNWGICPKCQQLTENEKSSYGKVPEEEYIKLISERKNVSHKYTLREDYEIWTDDKGLFYISYSCECSKCGFFHNFKHQQQLLNSRWATNLQRELSERL